MLVLQQNVFFNLSEADKENLLSSLNKILEKKSDELLKVCTAIQMVGIPKYYPKYMIQHGMQAIIESDGNGLVDEFNSEEAWSLALKNYLHCGE